MNSLNIISARVSPPSSPVSSRSNSLSAISLAAPAESTHEQDAQENAVKSAQESASPAPTESQPRPPAADANLGAKVHDLPPGPANEKTPLLPTIDEKPAPIRSSSSSPWQAIPRRITATLLSSIRLVLSALATPGVYLWAYFCDENGNFAPLHQLRKLFGQHNKTKIPKLAVYSSDSTDEDRSFNRASATSGLKAARRSVSCASSSGLSSESESDRASSQKRHGSSRSSGRRHSRSKSLQGTEETAPSSRSIRIKLHEDGSPRQRKHRKIASTSVAGTSRPAKAGAASGADGAGLSPPDVAAQLKSPTSPIGALTRYPKTPAPPRPLIPRRQPSYINFERPLRESPKTLILDLDETLIHSMSKGGRMGSGHMVEVRLNANMVGLGQQQNMNTQHPILYYVHKRPHCDEFLKKVQKWYNLVVFTASVQEYADPVIDFLEAERKFFTKRYYRQHCTFRHGAFIKDLSSVEPDLSKVMILDNSPLSYMFHQDNAIPIQGWINDPTDNDLLHLIPFLEGLQYVSDVRALLALRNGEDGEHSAA